LTHLTSLLVLSAAAALGGALNSVAGGGSFIVFPILLFTGTTPVIANATTTATLWPGSLASALGYREELRRSRKVSVALLCASLVGGALGAMVLLRTPDATFVKALPWLLLVAALVFSFGDPIAARLQRLAGGGKAMIAFGALLQLAISAYGGYFGGGMGIMMLAVFAVVGMTDIHEMNGLKTLLGTVINGVALALFVAAHAIAWEVAAPMIMFAVLGGYAGARAAKKVDPRWVKRFVAVSAWGLTGYFFWRARSP
jgi:uncharacterized membrane protein YfcA